MIVSGEVNTGEKGTYYIDYTYVDTAGNTGSTTRTVTVRDTIKPTASVEYIPVHSGWTTGDVEAIVTGFSEPITGLNATGNTFTGNGIFIFSFRDLAGNT